MTQESKPVRAWMIKKDEGDFRPEFSHSLDQNKKWVWARFIECLKLPHEKYQSISIKAKKAGFSVVPVEIREVKDE